MTGVDYNVLEMC